MPDPTWLKEDIATEITPPLVNMVGARSVTALQDVVRQFDVEAAARYKKRDLNGDGVQDTLCNFFAREVLRALSCDTPRQTANQMVDWFLKAQTTSPWAQIRQWVARELANAGLPTVALWQNSNGPHGHVAIVVPARTGLDRDHIMIAQAGGTNFEYARLEQGFGVLPVIYFAHP